MKFNISIFALFLLLLQNCSKHQTPLRTNQLNSEKEKNQNNFISDSMFNDLTIEDFQVKGEGILDSISDFDFITINIISQIDSSTSVPKELLFRDNLLTHKSGAFRKDSTIISLLDSIEITEFIPTKCLFTPTLGLRFFHKDSLHTDVIISKTCRAVKVYNDSIQISQTLYSPIQTIEDLEKLIYDAN